jgi:hypothetical protein
MHKNTPTFACVTHLGDAKFISYCICGNYKIRNLEVEVRSCLKKKQLKPHLTTTEILSKLMTCFNTHHRSYWQILLSVSFNPGKKAEEYVKILGVTLS